MSTTFTQDINDENVLIDTTATSAIVNLLSSAGFPTRPVTYGKETTDANTVTLQAASGETIMGSGSLILTTIGSVTIKSIPGGWWIESQTAVTTSGGGGGGGSLTLSFSNNPGYKGSPYLANLVANGGVLPYSFSKASGSFPGALSLNGSTGAITGTPTSTGVFNFVGQVTDSDTPPTTVTCNGSITVTATAPPDTTPGAETPNCTSVSATQIFQLYNADGGEAWQNVTTATPPSDARFAYAQAVYCPVAMFNGYGTAGTQMPSTSGGYAGGNITVIITPYAVPSIVNVSGTSITWVSGPKFNTALVRNLVAIGGQSCKIDEFPQDDQHATLTFAPTAQGSNKVFVPQEGRYGGMQDSSSSQIKSLSGSGKGDTVIIDSEKFTLVTGSNTLDTAGNSTVTLYRTPGAHPVHNSSVLNLTTGVWTTSTYMIDINGGGVKYIGDLYPNTTQAVSDQFPMGAPAWFILYLVSVSTAGIVNSWPVPGTTPQVGPYVAETVVTGRLDPRRLDSTQFGPGLSGGSGTPVQVSSFSNNLINNDGFDQTPIGTNWTTPLPTNWSFAATGASPTPHSGDRVLSIDAAHTGAISNENYVGCFPGQAYQASMFSRSSSTSGMGTLQIDIAFYAADQSFISFTSTPGTATASTSGWVLVGTGPEIVPTGAVFCRAVVHMATAGTGTWYVDDVSFVQLAPTGLGQAYDTSGNLIAAAAGTANLAQNPGFEYLPIGTNWTLTNAAILGPASPGNSGSHSGSYYVKCSGTGTCKVQQGPGTTSGSLACNAGETYTLSVWYRSDSGASGNLGLYFNVFNAAGFLTNGVSPNFNLSGAWSVASFTYTMPAGATSFNILPAFIAGGTGGSNGWYLDDVTLTKMAGVDGTTLVNQSNGLLAIPTGGVGSSQIAAAAVSASKIAAAAVTNAALAIASIQPGNIASLSTGNLSSASAIIGGLCAAQITAVLGIVTGGGIQVVGGGYLVNIGNGFGINVSNVSGNVVQLDNGYAVCALQSFTGQAFNGGYNSFTGTYSAVGRTNSLTSSYNADIIQSAIVITPNQSLSAGIGNSVYTQYFSGFFGQLMKLYADAGSNGGPTTINAYLYLHPSTNAPTANSGTFYFDSSGNPKFVCAGGSVHGWNGSSWV